MAVVNQNSLLPDKYLNFVAIAIDSEGVLENITKLFVKGLFSLTSPP